MDDTNGPEQAQQLAISGKQAIQQSIVKLTALAKREILIVLPYMHALWDDERITQGLLDFVRGSSRRDVLILINSLENQTAHTHQLVKIAQRVSSRIQLKQVAILLEPPMMSSDYLMIIDQQHILRVDDIEKFSAWFDVNYASRAQQYAGSFLQQWPKAREIAEYRQFYF